MQYSQWFLSYRAHKLFGWPSGYFFQNDLCRPSVFNGFFPKVNQIIKNTQGTTTSNLNGIQPMIHKISRPQAFRLAIFFKMSSVSHLVLDDFFPKVYQIIRNSQRTTTSNLNAIQPMVHRAPIFKQLFLMNSYQKVIR